LVKLASRWAKIPAKVEVRKKRGNFPYYGKIPPGTYTFRVVAANNDGVWNAKGDSFTLKLKPHFYQTIWFDVLCAVVVGIVLWRMIHFNERRMRRELELSLMQDSLNRRITAEARYRDLFESAVYGIYRSRRGSYLEVHHALLAMPAERWIYCGRCW